MNRQGSALVEWLTRRLRPRLGSPFGPRPVLPVLPAPGGVPAPGGPAPWNGPRCFSADFSREEQWVAGRSWAYPDGGPTNPGDNKLDHLVPDAWYGRAGTLRATRRPDGNWNAGLLTTEESAEGFTVRTGDVLETRVRLPTEPGAWPAIWTWRDGGNEVDVFEYHPDHPDLLELSNHVRGGRCFYTHPSIRPGARVDLRVEFRSGSVVWWVNGRHAYSDGRGVGHDWYAFLIVNLSVCAGRHHPAPDPSATAMSYEVDFLRVHRPAVRTPG